jgi:lipid-A-disaccharide synthase-like uncharacterized protein
MDCVTFRSPCSLNDWLHRLRDFSITLKITMIGCMGCMTFRSPFFLQWLVAWVAWHFDYPENYNDWLHGLRDFSISFFFYNDWLHGLRDFSITLYITMIGCVGCVTFRSLCILQWLVAWVAWLFDHLFFTMIGCMGCVTFRSPCILQWLVAWLFDHPVYYNDWLHGALVEVMRDVVRVPFNSSKYFDSDVIIVRNSA